ncbi:hypothetical protein L6452_10379 [Arctium lappa]|uniref:Uncharacterized protein n=1 Tax=Arctium lappa TaxID=4217 RepID=A0ACB9DMH2_ARCLA|nr:hypothetical protein L6452_10379 [Arctium lappa]
MLNCLYSANRLKSGFTISGQIVHSIPLLGIWCFKSKLYPLVQIKFYSDCCLVYALDVRNCLYVAAAAAYLFAYNNLLIADKPVKMKHKKKQCRD